MGDLTLHFQAGDTSFTVRAIALIIFENRLLVAKSNYHDCFYTVGGVVNVGESSAEAVIREVWEETGYHAEIDRLVFVQERFFLHDDKDHHEIAFFYLMKSADYSIKNGTKTDQEQEHLYWIPLDELSNVNLVPSFLKNTLTNIPATVVHIVSTQ